MTHDPNWTLLARFVAGECTSAEAGEVLARAMADPEYRELLESSRRAWTVSGNAGARMRTDAAWTRVRRRMDARPFPGRRLAIAAVVVMVVAGGAVGVALRMTPGLGDSPPAMRELATRQGQRARVRLPDGTRVVLGPESRLTVPGRFTGPTRSVALVGEGYFAVTPDASHPFVVRAGNTVTRVLGTQFDLRAYPTESTVAVVVAEGRVGFRRADMRESGATLILPGELGELTAGADQVVKRTVDVGLRTGWQVGRLTFQDARLSDVANQLERWYGRPVRVSGAALGERRLTASFHDQPIDEVVAIVAASLGLEVADSAGVYRFAARGRTRR
jgi:transmembrane sensor